jgi:hypothetical protein
MSSPPLALRTPSPEHLVGEGAMDHDDLVEEAKEAINKVFSDKSVPVSTTREDLKDLIDEIEIMLDTIKGS